MLGIDLAPEGRGSADRLARRAGRRRRSQLTGQPIGFSMVLIFLRSLVYNVLFYLLLVFWLIVAHSDLRDAALGDPERREILGGAAASG